MAEVDIAVTVDFTGIDALLSGLEARINAVIDKYAALIVARAKELSPVDTGALRASVTAHLTTLAAEITAGEGLPDARAVYMEYGTRYIRARSYLRPAVEQYRAAFLAELQTVFGG